MHQLPASRCVERISPSTQRPQMDPPAHRDSGSRWGLVCRILGYICFTVVLIILFPLYILGSLILWAYYKIWGAPVVVGIFSRSAEEDYGWLTQELHSQIFKGVVKEIRPVCIFNNGVQQFRAEVNECDFAILYHSKKRGRLNITNVTDAIYNYELNYLSDSLGREKVIVVVDDLDDSSEEEKSRIQHSQPDLGNRAQDLFLFTNRDKRNPQSLERRLKQMKHLMSSGSAGNINLCDNLNVCQTWRPIRVQYKQFGV